MRPMILGRIRRRRETYPSPGYSLRQPVTHISNCAFYININVCETGGLWNVIKEFLGKNEHVERHNNITRDFHAKLIKFHSKKSAMEFKLRFCSEYYAI